MTSAVDRMLANPPKGKTEEELSAEIDKKLFEREYKYRIVNLAARAMHPGWYDPKEKYSPEARATLQKMAEDKAKLVLRAIAPYIKEPH